jgi:hypothetical protein
VHAGVRAEVKAEVSGEIRAEIRAEVTVEGEQVRQEWQEMKGKQEGKGRQAGQGGQAGQAGQGGQGGQGGRGERGRHLGPKWCFALRRYLAFAIRVGGPNSQDACSIVSCTDLYAYGV